MIRELRNRWRQAALEPYTDAPTTTDGWLRALELGSDAAVRVVLEHLTNVINQRPDVEDDTWRRIVIEDEIKALTKALNVPSGASE